MRTANIRRIMKRLTTYLEWTVFPIFRWRQILWNPTRMIAYKPVA